MSVQGVVAAGKEAMEIAHEVGPALRQAFGGFHFNPLKRSAGTQGAREVASKSSASGAAAAANKKAAALAKKNLGGKVKTTPVPSLSIMASNPVRHISWHPMCPFPPVMTTCLAQTHQTFLRNDLTVGASFPTASSSTGAPSQHIEAKAGIDLLGVRANSPLYPFGQKNSSDFEGKHMPWHNYLMTNIYQNCIVYASVLHVEISDDIGAGAFASHKAPVTAVLKLHSGIQENGPYWDKPKKWSGSVWIESGAGSLLTGSAGTGDHTGRRGYQGQIDNITNWMMDGKGDFFERARLFEDQFVTVTMPGSENIRTTHLSGHWDLRTHEGVDWKDIIFRPEELDDDTIVGFAFGEDIGTNGPQPVNMPSIDANLHPVWYLFADSTDNNEKFTGRLNVRMHCEYKVAYYGLRAPFGEAQIDELDYTT